MRGTRRWPGVCWPDPDGVPATDDGVHIINLSLATTRPTGLIDVMIEMITCTDYDENDNDDKARCNTCVGAVIIAVAGNGASQRERQFSAADAA